MQTSALYLGRVTHQRTRPVTHSLSYRVFWLLLDRVEIDRLDRRLRRRFGCHGPKRSSRAVGQGELT